VLTDLSSHLLGTLSQVVVVASAQQNQELLSTVATDSIMSSNGLQ
jgi:hypothetical protein